MQFLSFSCSFLQKYCRNIGFQPLFRTWRPPPSEKFWIRHWLILRYGDRNAVFLNFFELWIFKPIYWFLILKESTYSNFHSLWFTITYPRGSRYIHTAVVRSEVHSEAGAAAVSDRQEGDRLEGDTPWQTNRYKRWSSSSCTLGGHIQLDRIS